MQISVEVISKVASSNLRFSDIIIPVRGEGGGGVHRDSVEVGRGREKEAQDVALLPNEIFSSIRIFFFKY